MPARRATAASHAVNTWVVDQSESAGLSTRAVSLLGTTAAIGFACIIVQMDLARSPLWTWVMWGVVGVAAALAVVMCFTSRALTGTGAATFTLIADIATAATVCAVRDPLLGAYVATGVLAILGNFAVFYAAFRGYVAHLIAATAIAVLALSRVDLHGGGVLVAAVTVWLSVGMHPLTRKIWDSNLGDAALAFHDPLTRTTNRAGLVRNFSFINTDAVKRRHAVAVIVVDLDRFKAVNDTFGHAVGDLVLIETARHLFLHFGPSSTVSRSGGEEFVVIARGKQATVRGQVDTLSTATPGLTAPPITMSAGAVWCDLTDRSGCALDVAISRADAAMYSAKRHGGNVLCASW